MLIKDLNYMESVVDSRSDLEWEGWNVVKYTKNSASFMSVDGVFKDGSWYKKQVYEITKDGWSVPGSFGRS